MVISKYLVALTVSAFIFVILVAVANKYFAQDLKTTLKQKVKNDFLGKIASVSTAEDQTNNDRTNFSFAVVSDIHNNTDQLIS